MDPFQWLIAYLAPALDGTSMVGLFQYTLLLLPTLAAVRLMTYWVVLTAVRQLTNIRI